MARGPFGKNSVNAAREYLEARGMSTGKIATDPYLIRLANASYRGATDRRAARGHAHTPEHPGEPKYRGRRGRAGSHAPDVYSSGTKRSNVLAGVAATGAAPDDVIVVAIRGKKSTDSLTWQSVAIRRREFEGRVEEHTTARGRLDAVELANDLFLVHETGLPAFDRVTQFSFSKAKV